MLQNRLGHSIPDEDRAVVERNVHTDLTVAAEVKQKLQADRFEVRCTVRELLLLEKIISDVFRTREGDGPDRARPRGVLAAIDIENGCKIVAKAKEVLARKSDGDRLKTELAGELAEPRIP